MWFLRCNGSLLQDLDEFLRHELVYVIVEVGIHLFCQFFLFLALAVQGSMWVSFWSVLFFCQPLTVSAALRGVPWGSVEVHFGDDEVYTN